MDMKKRAIKPPALMGAAFFKMSAPMIFLTKEITITPAINPWITLATVSLYTYDIPLTATAFEAGLRRL
jgi:hypothetical protein